MPYSKESYEASKKYKGKKIKRVPLDMQLEAYETLRQAAERNNESVNGFIKTAIKERVERLGGPGQETDSSGQQ